MKAKDFKNEVQSTLRDADRSFPWIQDLEKYLNNKLIGKMGIESLHIIGDTIEIFFEEDFYNQKIINKITKIIKGALQATKSGMPGSVVYSPERSDEANSGYDLPVEVWVFTSRKVE